MLGAPLAASAKPFIDERFVLDIPDGYVVSNRKATTGTLFVAGNFPRASVVSSPTAGLKAPPLIGPRETAIASTVKPMARPKKELPLVPGAVATCPG